MIPSATSQNWYVEYFDLVSVSQIPEYSPDGDPWTEGESIPVTVTVRSESNQARYVYMFAESNSEYWIDIDPWEKLVPAGETVAIKKNIIVPNMDGHQTINVCILDDKTDAGSEYCGSAGKAYFEESESYFIWCCFGIGAVLGVLVLVSKKLQENNQPKTQFESWLGKSAYSNVAKMSPKEQYVQQLIAQGYPEETARAYAQQDTNHFE